MNDQHPQGSQQPQGGLFSSEFCEQRCPICRRARRGIRWARLLQALELLVTGGGCPWGRARQRKYGVPPGEPLPAQPEHR